jgi:hypothetical protein
MSVIPSTSGRLLSEYIRILFLQDLTLATSRHLTSSLSLGVPVPRPTQSL